MPHNKEAYIRYKIIDACIKKHKQNQYPSMELIIEKCHDKLGKSFTVSCIQKDIRAMKEDDLLGFYAPIKYSKRCNGYYYSSDYDFGQIPLLDNEIDALRAAGELLQVFSGSRVSESFDLALSKILASLSENFEKGENQLPVVFTENPPKQRGWEFFDFFLNTIKTRTPVSFVYYSFYNNSFKALVYHPYQLIEFNNYWYVIGYYEKGNQVCSFGLDCIYDPVELNLTYNDSKINEVEKYNKEMYGVLPLQRERKKQKIYFKSSSYFSKYLCTHPLHHSQQIEKHYDHGSKLFSICVIPTIELAKWFFANSSDVSVIDNPIIKKELIEMINASKLNLI